MLLWYLCVPQTGPLALQGLRTGCDVKDPSWVLVLLNAYVIAVEEERVALDMVLHVQDDHPKKRLKNGSFSPQKWTIPGSVSRKCFKNSSTTVGTAISRKTFVSSEEGLSIHTGLAGRVAVSLGISWRRASPALGLPSGKAKGAAPNERTCCFSASCDSMT